MSLLAGDRSAAIASPKLNPRLLALGFAERHEPKVGAGARRIRSWKVGDSHVFETHQ